MPAPSSTPSASDGLEHAGPEPLQPVAGLLALALPGLGHIYLGAVRRGVLIMIGVLGLFFGGLALGGIDCVDRRENFIWFLGQSLVGPVAFGVDYVHQTTFKVYSPRNGQIQNPRPEEARDPSTGLAVPIDFSGPVPSAKVVDPAAFRAARFSGGSFDPTSSAHRTEVASLPRVTMSPAYPPKVRSLSRVNELGTLYTTIAGFMNLICVIDALWHHRVSKARPKAVGPRTLRVPGSLAGTSGTGGTA